MLEAVEVLYGVGGFWQTYKMYHYKFLLSEKRESCPSLRASIEFEQVYRVGMKTMRDVALSYSYWHA